MKWVKYLFIFVLLTGIAWCGWLIYAKDYIQLAVTIVMWLFFAGIFVFLINPIVRTENLIERLDKVGTEVKALIVSVNDTAKYINQRPVLRIQVKYSYNGKPDIVGEIEQAIPFHLLSTLQPSKQTLILVDPKDETRFVLKL